MQGDRMCPATCTLPVGYPEAPSLGLEAGHQMRQASVAIVTVHIE